jgi:hypothetical protein
MVQDDAAQPKTWVHVALGLQASAWCWHKCNKTLGAICGDEDNLVSAGSR